MTRRTNPDPLLRALPAPFRKVLYPLGKPLLVESNDAHVLECARLSFGHFPRAGASGRVIRLRLLRDPQAGSRPPWPRALFRSWQDLLWISCGGDNVAVADLQKRQAVGYFSGSMLEDAEFFRWTFLDALTYSTLVWHDFTFVHAAAVVREGLVFCLAGPAGTGKTSLAYHCARHGYRLLGDDAVLLSHRPGALRLRGNPARLHFAVEARQLFPELVQCPVSLRHDGREFLAIAPKKLGVRTVVGESKAGAVVFLDRGGKPGLRRVPAPEAFELLYRPRPLYSPRVMQAQRRDIARLVRCGAFRMGYRTLDEALELLNRIPLPTKGRS